LLQCTLNKIETKTIMTNIDATIKSDGDSLILVMESEKAHQVLAKQSYAVRSKFKGDRFKKMIFCPDYRKTVKRFLTSNDLAFTEI
jgi:hypothetical protein